MSLLDEWEAGGTRAYGDARPSLEPVLSDDGSDGGLASPRGVVPDVIFSLETVERHIARCRPSPENQPCIVTCDQIRGCQHSTITIHWA
jgi:hypothetical protein